MGFVSLSSLPVPSTWPCQTLKAVLKGRTQPRCWMNLQLTEGSRVLLPVSTTHLLTWANSLIPWYFWRTSPSLMRDAAPGSLKRGRNVWRAQHSTLRLESVQWSQETWPRHGISSSWVDRGQEQQPAKNCTIGTHFICQKHRNENDRQMSHCPTTTLSGYRHESVCFMGSVCFAGSFKQHIV